MNCIFICVFNEEKYLDMVYLLLESIFIYGNLDDKTNILIYTSTIFMNKIKEHDLFIYKKINFEINDTYNDISNACKSRLDLFNLSSVSNYDKILYLDTDILVKDDINKVFDVCKEDVLYAMQDGRIDSPLKYWGNNLFGDEVNNYDDKTAFTSGMLLFNNSEKMKFLFDKINEDYIVRQDMNLFFDQPYIIYNSFKYNLYNNKALLSVVVNCEDNIYTDRVVYHFQSGPGSGQHKLNLMTKFFNDVKNYSIKNNTTKIPKPLSLSDFESTHIDSDIWTCSYKMRYNIYEFFKYKRHFKIAELGSYKGYSTKVLSKIFKRVYAVDGSIEWTNFNKELNKDSTNIEYVMLDMYKDSWNVLPDDIEIAFVDCPHNYENCKSDVMNSIKHFKKLKYFVFRNYGDWCGVKKIVDEMTKNNTLKFEKFIGINDVPGLNRSIFKNINEGIICSVNYNINEIVNKKYTWKNKNLIITFLDNNKMDAFGKGEYEIIDKNNIIAKFGGKVHDIHFYENYSFFISTRRDDLQIIFGELLL
uniref:Uncharacterized protein n=1 Tax=viral metagenome TaxID=1070528 RepID=A0A6C0KV58_9ZZZZ